MAKQQWQVAGSAGILFVVFFVVGAGVSGDVPTYDEGGQAIAVWFAENGEEYLAGDFITALGFIFFYFPFLAALYARLRAAEGDPAMLSRAALIGGILFPVAGLAGGLSLAALALLEGEVSADAASLASATAFHGFTAAGAVSAVFMGAASLVIRRTGVFWSWLGWLGILVALAAVVGSATGLENDPEGVLAIIGFIAFVGLGVWILAVSVALLRTPASEGAAAM